jgi:2-iminobutanoate/2-iminopropanoate deaminase
MSNDSTAAAFGLPYSTIRQVENFYYISGHTGVDLATKTAAPDVAGQTKKLFQALTETLIQYNLSLNDIVKTTVFLTDMADFAEMNNVYVNYFNDPKPARSTIAVRELPRVAGDTALRVEIEAIAYKKPM